MPETLRAESVDPTARADRDRDGAELDGSEVAAPWDEHEGSFEWGPERD